MSIRTKIILVLIPLIIAIVALVGIISIFFTRIGITRLASRSLSFKSIQLENYTNEQWALLVDDDLSTQVEYLDAFIGTVREYAIRTLIEEESELIFVYNSNPITNSEGEKVYEIVFASDSIDIKQEDIRLLNEIIAEQKQNVHLGNFLQKNFVIDNTNRIGYYFDFDDRGWTFVLSNKVSTFYKPVYDITTTTIIITIIAIIAGIIVILMFTNTLVAPLKQMLNSMKNIIKTNNLTERVKVEYKDEVGQVSKTFNIMIEELEKASESIKQFAFSSILAKRNENKIRNIFQKYVPNSVINDLFKDPTKMLEGQSRKIAIIFTDIRGFTTISEKFTPDELVKVLNTYFETIVEIITNHGGIIDKYIGDAVMAFFGAPMELENPSYVALQACNEMRIAIDNFNQALEEQGLPLFRTGIGLNYGLTTVGNIGSEKKMDYTIIGDEVNLGSRLEGLTKQYGVDFIFSHSVQQQLPDTMVSRFVDLVQVKGKTRGELIYTTDIHMTPEKEALFTIHNKGFEAYCNKQFQRAVEYFRQVQTMDATDTLSTIFIDRCNMYISTPPPPSWNGIYVATKK